MAKMPIISILKWSLRIVLFAAITMVVYSVLHRRTALDTINANFEFIPKKRNVSDGKSTPKPKINSTKVEASASNTLPDNDKQVLLHVLID